MDKLRIRGGKRLKGEVRIEGAKNSCLPIMAAMLLTDGECRIENVPPLRDVDTMLKILTCLGVSAYRDGGDVVRREGAYKGITAPYDIVSTMRASICVLGPLLAKQKAARVSFPGGCVIGPRPIDLHLKGLREFGADIKVDEGYINARAKRLTGREIYLGGHFGSSVLATGNVMMAATLAKGETVIHNAASEPEVKDLGEFLVKMGADITGYGTPTVSIRGVKSLHGASHRVIPDRVEAGTYMIASAITEGDISVKDVEPGHMMALMDKLREIGCEVTVNRRSVRVKRSGKRPKAVAVTTLPYPGFPTDLQAQVMSLLSVADGISIITEKIYPERFIHISELNRMGSDIILEGPNAIVKGTDSLSGADVMASDLRASAALVLAGLVARGETTVHRVYHIDRGYAHIETKLAGVGADIQRVKE
ncbi:MAG: UDP-N-acetylglucosamine 1-carboxyvinyltransferase [Candidatus Omnitrophota bacterium]